MKIFSERVIGTGEKRNTHKNNRKLISWNTHFVKELILKEALQIKGKKIHKKAEREKERKNRRTVVKGMRKEETNQHILDV